MEAMSRKRRLLWSTNGSSSLCFKRKHRNIKKRCMLAILKTDDHHARSKIKEAVPYKLLTLWPE